jgi:hypothetical protein
MAVYDEPAIVHVASLESEWKIASLSFNQTFRTNRRGASARYAT